MIIKEYPYIDLNGVKYPNLKRIYSDLGCRLIQLDTQIIYTSEVIDSVNSNHSYIEMLEDLGSLPTQDFENKIEKV